MRIFFALLIFITGVCLGAVAGHYHGEAIVYRQILNQKAELLETLK